MTTEQEKIEYWLNRLRYLEVTDFDFSQHREQLSRQFGFTTSVNDTIWRTLNSLVGKYAQDPSRPEYIYREMAVLVSREEKDPTQYLEQADQIRREHGERIALMIV